MKTEESLPKGIIKRIVFIVVILLLLMGACVFASVTSTNTVTIVFSDNTELAVITNKKNISEILTENNIILVEGESVNPSLDSEIDSTRKIQIVNTSESQTSGDENVEIVSSDIVSQTDNVVEKLIVEKEKIPYETITKEVNVKKGDTKTSTVVQKGEDGIKEVTYKVKYENDVEVERTKVSEKVIKEATDKIVQVKKKTTTRSGQTRGNSAVSTGNGTWSYSASDIDLLCAITATECSSSYSGALAVITTACNRAESSQWKSRGTDPLSQYKAKGQFCYSINSVWVKRLNGNYPSYVKKAVTDALNGTRNHNYLSFRAASTGHSGTVIGGNVYFNKLK